MTKNWLIALLSVPMFTSGCVEPDDPFDGVNPDTAAVQFDGKADGDDVTVRAGRPYSRVILRGDAALALWDVMESGGGFTATRSRGLDYLYGFYSICASNGTAAGCSVYSRTVTSGNDVYDATVHGPRANSAASEIFGAIARSQNLNPRRAAEVSSDRIDCGKDRSSVWCGIKTVRSSRQLTLSLSNLGNLGPDFVYEGWLITSAGPVSTGRFALSASSGTGTFDLPAALVDDATVFVLTIEPAVGDAPEPSATHVLAGPIANNTADLVANHPAAFGTDFALATGKYILETPSTSSVAMDYDQGVWFINPGTGPGLDLPTLPDGWVYEGWVVGDNGPVSTGTFTMTDQADSDAAGPASGPDAAPPFPGQDFIDPAMNLVGNTVVISVEPSPDNDSKPFFIKPLVDMNATDLGAGVTQAMQNVAADSLPSGTISID